MKDLKHRTPRTLAGAFGWLGILCLLPGISGFSQQSSTKPPAQAVPVPTAPSSPDEVQDPLPGDWGPELLDGILSSSNEEAQYALLRATFAAGPAIVPQLAEALKDDRTAEFAAQSLAFIGGDRALDILWKLLSDTRDLNLQRFTYGAMAEYDVPQATDLLFDVINKSDDEPDRTVTETAVIALTVRTDPTVLARLHDAESKLQDVVIRDDLDNARAVIAARSKYLASPAGKKSSGSVESAVRTYFIPALETPSAPETTPVSKKPVGKPAAPAVRAEPRPQVKVEVRNVTLSPDRNRALTRVVFEDPTAEAYYDIVLQKRNGDWSIASVWLGPEVEKPGTTASHHTVEANPE
jgi:hypothetical protein